MLELLGVLAILVVGGLAIGVLGIVVWLLKLVFKIALIPLSLSLTLVKGLALVVVSVLALVVVAPVVIGLGLAVLVPLAMLGAMVWAGVALVT